MTQTFTFEDFLRGQFIKGCADIPENPNEAFESWADALNYEELVEYADAFATQKARTNGGSTWDNHYFMPDREIAEARAEK